MFNTQCSVTLLYLFTLEKLYNFVDLYTSVEKYRELHRRTSFLFKSPQPTEVPFRKRRRRRRRRGRYSFSFLPSVGIYLLLLFPNANLSLAFSQITNGRVDFIYLLPSSKVKKICQLEALTICHR